MNAKMHLKINKQYGWWVVSNKTHTPRWIVPAKFFTWQDAMNFAYNMTYGKARGEAGE